MRIIQKAAEYIKKNQIEVIGHNPTKITIQVGDHLVLLKKKAGRVLDSCSCENHSRFVNENPRCSHKISAACWLCMKGLKWK